MRLRLKNVRNVRQAEIDLSGQLTLVAGPNGQGKTTALLALCCLVDGTRNPVLGSGRGHEGEELLTWGLKKDERDGYMILEGDGWKRTITLPGFKRTFTGEAGPRSSAFALGMVRLEDLHPRERAAKIAEIMRATPTISQFETAFREARCPGDYRDVWKRLTDYGWDHEHERTVDEVKVLKRDWQKIAQRPWGKDVAEGWRAEPSARPPGEAEGQDLGALEQTQRSAASALQEREKELAALEEESRQKRAEHGTLHVIECRQCGTRNAVVHDPARKELVAHDPDHFGPEHLEALRAAAKEMAARIQTARDSVAEARRRSVQAELEYERAKAARDAVARERGQSAADKTREARKIHDEIMGLLRLGAIVAPEGLRHKATLDAIRSFNDDLRKRCHRMKIPVVQLDLDRLSMVDDAGRTYLLRSTGQQWAMEVALQLELASKDGSELILVDSADHVRKEIREPAFHELIRTRIKTVAAMAETESQRFVSVPDLAKYKVGRTYWVRDGAYAPLNSGEAERAA